MQIEEEEEEKDKEKDKEEEDIYVLCCSLALVSGQDPNPNLEVECPPDNENTTNVPDPEDCTSYYFCANGCAVHTKVIFFNFSYRWFINCLYNSVRLIFSLTLPKITATIPGLLTVGTDHVWTLPIVI